MRRWVEIFHPIGKSTQNRVKIIDFCGKLSTDYLESFPQYGWKISTCPWFLVERNMHSRYNRRQNA